MQEAQRSWLWWLWPAAEDEVAILPAGRGRVRLRTLSNLRWLAVGGQSVTLLLVHFGLGYPLPLLRCVLAIAASAALNGFLALRYPPTHRLTNRAATIYLAYDVLQLAALLYLTGGIENPFALMFLAPVVIAAATLDLTNTLLLVIIAFASVCIIAVVHMPLPWARNETLELPPKSPEAEDARLLRQEAERCRNILARLARPEESVMSALERLPLGALLDDIASPYRGDDLAIQIEIAEACRALPQPKVWRAPALLHGLGNVIANAADFARSKVRVAVQWSDTEIRVSVEDDGPGFAPDIIERIGEPYVTSRPGSYALDDSELSPDALGGQQGMGLGFFIAKTLIEQTRGSVRARNLEGSGARVTARWPRGAIDGDVPPGREALI